MTCVIRVITNRTEHVVTIGGTKKKKRKIWVGKTQLKAFLSKFKSITSKEVLKGNENRFNVTVMLDCLYNLHVSDAAKNITKKKERNFIRSVDSALL